MELPLAVVGAAVLVFWPLVVCGALLLRLAGRYRRRGGGLKLAASNGSKAVTTRTTDGTRLSVVYSNSGGQRGYPLEAKAILPDTAGASRPTALGFLVSLPVLGDSPGQRRQSAASGDA